MVYDKGAYMSTPYTKILEKDIEDITPADLEELVKYEREARARFEEARAAPKKSKKSKSEGETE